MAGTRGPQADKAATAHWWAQRVTAIALVPLGLWLVVSLIGLTGAGHRAVTEWLACPTVAVLLPLTLLAGFYHAWLGLQVVIDDYVHGPAARLATLIVVQFACVLAGAAGLYAVLRVAFAGS